MDGTLYDFLLLATRREDADTLFFNRRLRLGGDTELGLYVKNFLDALELDGRLGPLPGRNRPKQKTHTET
ncbi:MAG: SCP2 sterol-binding domain-containing protein [Candidatus Sedimenticola endophacoides]